MQAFYDVFEILFGSEQIIMLRMRIQMRKMRKLNKTISLILMVIIFCMSIPIQAKAAAGLNITNITLISGKSTVLKVNGTKAKSWTSSDKSIATVSKNGKVTAKIQGTVYIGCKAQNGKTYKCKVNVRPKNIGQHEHYYTGRTVIRTAKDNSPGLTRYACKKCGKVINKHYGKRQVFTHRLREEKKIMYGYWNNSYEKSIMNSINAYRKSKGLKPVKFKKEYNNWARKQVIAGRFNIIDFDIVTESGRTPSFICDVPQLAATKESFFDDYIKKPGNDGISNVALFEKENIEVGIGVFTNVRYSTLYTDDHCRYFSMKKPECIHDMFVAVCIYEK